MVLTQFDKYQKRFILFLILVISLVLIGGLYSSLVQAETFLNNAKDKSNLIVVESDGGVYISDPYNLNNSFTLDRIELTATDFNTTSSYMLFQLSDNSFNSIAQEKRFSIKPAKENYYISDYQYKPNRSFRIYISLSGSGKLTKPKPIFRQKTIVSSSWIKLVFPALAFLIGLTIAKALSYDKKN